MTSKGWVYMLMPGLERRRNEYPGYFMAERDWPWLAKRRIRMMPGRGAQDIGYETVRYSVEAEGKENDDTGSKQPQRCAKKKRHSTLPDT